jgi:drug/metabolite transporter (DMT)-like permease
MEQVGALGGAALMYSFSSLLLIIFVGFPKINSFNWRYLLFGSALFASYEVLFSLSFGWANNRTQAIEVSIVNYLWPALTVLFATLFSQTKPSIFLYPSMLIAFSGVVLSLSEEDNLSFSGWLMHINDNPTVYVMALVGAFIWAGYCILTKKQKKNGNLITVFFMVTSLVLWIKFLTSESNQLTLSGTGMGLLLISAGIMAGGYALWNVAIVGGNMVFLATLSYFVPVLSAFLSSITLAVVLPNMFWLGAIMVTIGSLMCWWFTRSHSINNNKIGR